MMPRWCSGLEAGDGLEVAGLDDAPLVVQLFEVLGAGSQLPVHLVRHVQDPRQHPVHRLPLRRHGGLHTARNTHRGVV